MAASPSCAGSRSWPRGPERSSCPHHWKTGISAAAAQHFQAATPNVPYVELLSPVVFDSPLRAELTRPEPELEDGTFPLPTAPGLGVELVDEAVERYAVVEG